MTTSISTNVTRPAETNGGVVTSWLPVTSAWPSVEPCSAAIYSQVGNIIGLAAIAFDPFFGENINTELTCLPPFATSWWDQQQQTPAQTVTSLGPLVCPGLYTTATSSILNSMSTFIACCPTNYAFQSILPPGSLGQCNSALTVGQLFTYRSGDTVQSAWVETSTTINEKGASVFGIAVNGYIFASTTSPSASLSLTTPSTSLSLILPFTSLSLIPPSPSLLSTSLTSLLSTKAPSTSGIAPGVKTGIGVGVTLAVVGLCFILGAILLTRQRKQHPIAEDGGELTAVTASKDMCWQDNHALELAQRKGVYEMS